MTDLTADFAQLVRQRLSLGYGGANFRNLYKDLQPVYKRGSMGLARGSFFREIADEAYCVASFLCKSLRI